MGFIYNNSSSETVHGEQSETDDIYSFFADKQKDALKEAVQTKETRINKIGNRVVDGFIKNEGRAATKEISQSAAEHTLESAAKKTTQELSKELAKQSVKRMAEVSTKKTAETVTKETAKAASSEIAKEVSTFVVTTTSSIVGGAGGSAGGAAVGGTAGTVAGPYGTLIGIGAGMIIGEVVGDAGSVVLDNGVHKISQKERMIKGLTSASRQEGDGNAIIKSAGRNALQSFLQFIKNIAKLKYMNLKWMFGGSLGFAITILVVLLLLCSILIVPIAVYSSSFSWFENFDGESGLIDDYVYFNQHDYRNIYLSDTDTVSSSGCGVCGFAMLVANLTDTEITPDDMADFANHCVEQGYWANGVAQTYVQMTRGMDEYGLQARSCGTNLETALEIIQQGGLVYISVGRADGGGNELFRGQGHMIIIRGITEDGELLLLDPNRTSNTETAWNILTVKEILKYCYQVWNPDTLVSDGTWITVHGELAAMDDYIGKENYHVKNTYYC